MIKLKSLFRRGNTSSQGPGESGSNSKHSSRHHRSQSTQSLNAAVENENNSTSTGSCPQHAGATSNKCQISNTVPHKDCCERPVDVGDEQLNQIAAGVCSSKSQPDGGVQSHSHTLPHKKQKRNTAKKGLKQPKLFKSYHTESSKTSKSATPATAAATASICQVINETTLNSMAPAATGQQAGNPLATNTSPSATADISSKDNTATNADVAAAAASNHQLLNNQQQILEVDL